MKNLSEISSVRLRDLEIFNEVARARSIREAARRLGSTSGQISKSVQNLERLIGIKLFRRSVSGVLLTSQGSEMQSIVQEVLDNSQRIEQLAHGGSRRLAKNLAIAGTAFLNTHFITPIVCELSASMPEMAFRFLDLAPDQIVAAGLRGGFDLAVHFDPLSWPSTWETRPLGKSSWKLCARPEHPLRARPPLKQILEYPFVVPTYWTSEGLITGNDRFPLPFSKRRRGFETATAEAAIPILFKTDHVAFLPSVLVDSYLKSRQLREIKCHEVEPVERKLFLSAKSDTVPHLVFQRMIAGMSASLEGK